MFDDNYETTELSCSNIQKLKNMKQWNKNSIHIQSIRTHKMKKIKIVASLLIFLTALMMNHASAQPPAAVKVTAVKNTMMAPVRKVPAMVAAKFIARIKNESRGTVNSISEVGTLVKQGEVIAELVDTQVRHRKDELNGEVKSSEAKLAFLRSENKRLNGLVAKNLISSSELEQNKSDLVSAQNDLNQIKARLEQYLDFVDKLSILAPYNGVVLQQLSQPGQLLSAGDDVLEFMQADNLEVVVNVPVKYKSQIRNGAIWKIETTADNDGEKRVMDVEISRFVPAARGQSRTIEVHLSVASEYNLWPGEAVNVLVPTQQKRAVVAVPRDALVIRKSGAFVYTVEQGKSHQVNVMTGMAEGDMIEVKGLLSEGDMVIIRGNERLRNDQPVNMIE